MAEHTAPFLEHIRELRRRVVWSVLFVGMGAGVGYVLYDKLLFILQLPYKQDLYYTAPTGALSFLIKVCLTFGLIIGLPIMVYHLLSFIAPVVNLKTRKTILVYLLTSILLAATGIAFAYFISMPAALHFLVNFGNPESVKALITANEYFNFVLAYLAGFAVLFQIPLIVMGANRLTPLKPLKLLGGTKYVVLLSFIISAILTPTPDPINQAIMAGPMIVLYLFSVGLVAVFGKKPKHSHGLQDVPAKTTQQRNYPVMQDDSSLSATNPHLALVIDTVVPSSSVITSASASIESNTSPHQKSTMNGRPARLISDFQLVK